jgi:hypothetical protein
MLSLVHDFAAGDVGEGSFYVMVDAASLSGCVLGLMFWLRRKTFVGS